jgi:hypothetical protein
MITLIFTPSFFKVSAFFRIAAQRAALSYRANAQNELAGTIFPFRSEDRYAHLVFILASQKVILQGTDSTEQRSKRGRV